MLLEIVLEKQIQSQYRKDFGEDSFKNEYY